MMRDSLMIHEMLDLHGSIPSFIHITDGKTHEVNVLTTWCSKPGRSTDGSGLSGFQQAACHSSGHAFFVTRAKSNTQFKRRYSTPVDRSTTSVICAWKTCSVE